MHTYNRETGQYEPVDMDAYLRTLRIRSEIVRRTTDPCEAFANGGDFQDMAEAKRRQKEQGAA